ncbi:MAG: MDR/zinc-dependent alcohol dehydrogenase-like family protein, partial [Planctomycetaceae bacterium]
MRAAIIRSPGRIEIDDVPLPEPGPGQVRVRLEGCGVCASNLPVWEGRPWFEYPFAPGAPGHEGWGVVDAMGENVTSLRMGDSLALLSDHAYAEYDLADADAVVKRPAGGESGPFPAEPLGCAMNVFRRSGIERGGTVAIIGVGFLGALLVQLASAAGARVIAVSRRPFALDAARRGGAEETFALDDRHEVARRINQLTGGDGCDVVIEATGLQEPLDLAADVTRIRGRLVIAGYHQDGLRTVNMQHWNWRGLDVINAHERDPAVYIEGIRQGIAAVAE